MSRPVDGMSFEELLAQLEVLRGYHRAGDGGYTDEAGPLSRRIGEIKAEIEARLTC